MLECFDRNDRNIWAEIPHRTIFIVDAYILMPTGPKHSIMFRSQIPVYIPVTSANFDSG